MKKLKAVALFLLLLFFLASCASEKTIYQPREYGAGSVVAVWDLEDLSITPHPALTDMQEFLTAQVIETLRDTGGYQLVERQKLLLALEELHLGSSNLASDSSRLRVGQIIGAQLMVFGGYQLIGEQLRIDLRMIEVESGVVVKTAEQTTTAAVGGGIALFASSSSDDDDDSGGGDNTVEGDGPTVFPTKAEGLCLGDSVVFSFSESMNMSGTASVDWSGSVVLNGWQADDEYVVSWAGDTYICSSTTKPSLTISFNPKSFTSTGGETLTGQTSFTIGTN